MMSSAQISCIVFRCRCTAQVGSGAVGAFQEVPEEFPGWRSKRFGRSFADQGFRKVLGSWQKGSRKFRKVLKLGPTERYKKIR